MSTVYINTPCHPAAVEDINFNGRVIPLRGQGVTRVVFEMRADSAPSLIVEYAARQDNSATALLLQAVAAVQ